MEGKKWLVTGLACLSVFLSVRLLMQPDSGSTPVAPSPVAAPTVAEPEAGSKTEPTVDEAARAAYEENHQSIVVNSVTRGDEPDVPADPRTSTIDQVIIQAVPMLMNLPDVVSVAEGMCEDGPCVKVYMAKENPETKAKIPSEMEGFPVTVEYRGQPKAGM
ncbi:MAG: hypothetical protein CL799_07460 [Chromatiales bacterium]|jgi:hypothetical protein|nr:hypothetical protein [Chromatiales bacterium]MDP7271796.1 hypothetical protein [Gammaproteobacteria bacterium]HJP05467.1 hypothetical protein [Gammaproteobacteria bacterium]